MWMWKLVEYDTKESQHAIKENCYAQWRCQKLEWNAMEGVDFDDFSDVEDISLCSIYYLHTCPRKS